ncbi:ATP-binding protein [Nocardioides sp. B-3]|uniref:ATP-binding protein n=1 Tax=Nocardioides sp. B-3 TaxID=2895565 RepID=UPI0021520D03|nr:adenylate/guanylate cyclase domain-containing protein [Nocardioides sp. B-3]UUZ60503.1 AAA family ATPase [Nocardioides sp. B-3]
MRRVIERHGGVVEKFIGDAIMAVFGIPQLHEDDAVRAARAAHEMSTTLAELNEELEAGWGVRIQNRTGVNTGEVVTNLHAVNEQMVTGDAVNVAARLEQHARPGQILLGEATQRLVRDCVLTEPVEPLLAKGKSAPVPAWELKDVIADAPRLRRHPDSPMVGRERELAQLEGLFDDCLTGGCRLATIVAAPGLGKSRIVHEISARVGDRARVTIGRCLSYGDGATYWPLREIVRDLAGLDHDAVARVMSGSQLADAEAVVGALTGAIGLSDTIAPTTEIALGRPADVRGGRRRRTLGRGVRRHPLGRAGAARPHRARGDAGHERAPAPHLHGSPRARRGARRLGLDRAVARAPDVVPAHGEGLEQLVDNLLDGADMPQAVHDEIVRNADGNPLFVEELMRMFVDDDLLVRSEDGWRAVGVHEIAIPPSVSAILDTRLDRMGHGERALLHRAAVVGREFYREAVLHLTEPEQRAEMDTHLRSLVRKQLVRPVGSGFAGADAYAFSHLLARESAYASISREERATLHERFAGWLESTAAGGKAEFAEIIAYHLEQAAHQFRRLGPRRRPQPRPVGAGRPVALLDRRPRPGPRRRLRRREPARTCRGRAVRHRPRASGGAACPRPRALAHHGRFEDADRLLTEAIEGAEATGDRGVVELSRLDLAFVRLQFNPDDTLSRLVQETDAAYVRLTEAGNHEGLAAVWRLRAELHFMSCAYGATTAALEKALKHARLADDAHEEAAITIWLASCPALGPTPVPDAIETCGDLLKRARGSRRVEAAVHTVLGYLYALDGRAEEARRALAEAAGRYDELGLTTTRSQWSFYSGMALLTIGDSEAAEQDLRQAHDHLTSPGERFVLPTIDAYLARIPVVRGQVTEARALTETSKRDAAADDVASQIVPAGDPGALPGRGRRPGSRAGARRLGPGARRGHRRPWSCWRSRTRCWARPGGPPATRRGRPSRARPRCRRTPRRGTVVPTPSPRWGRTEPTPSPARLEM